VAFEICMRGSERDCHISREREREREGRHWLEYCRDAWIMYIFRKEAWLSIWMVILLVVVCISVNRWL
jgi:hypothetical protein